jgi:hypothetical protein
VGFSFDASLGPNVSKSFELRGQKQPTRIGNSKSKTLVIALLIKI